MPTHAAAPRPHLSWLSMARYPGVWKTRRNRSNWPRSKLRPKYLERSNGSNAAKRYITCVVMW